MAGKEKLKAAGPDMTVLEKGPPIIYKLNCKLQQNTSKSKSKKFDVAFHEAHQVKPEKVILVVGATGSGKSTLINGMVNYIFGIEFEDDFRLKLIDEEQVSQTHSQTKCITSYTIHHNKTFRVEYTFTIIDTPGFGDTSGIQNDQEIIQQVTDFFSGDSGMTQLDAVCFVVQSSLRRLTSTQRYIFDSILHLFGKNVEQNIFMMLTFADFAKPQVLSSLEEAGLPHEKDKWFKFNNSALYTNNQTDNENDSEDEDNGDTFDKLSWKMGVVSMKKFFVKVTPVSLILTQEDLKERRQLEVYVDGIQSDVQLGIDKLQQLKTEVQVIMTHASDIEKNKEFDYIKKKVEFILEPVEPGMYTTACAQCRRTCHYPCMCKDDSDKKNCSAMSGGNCKVCPGNCNWRLHKTLPYKYKIEVREVKITSQELKAKYEKAIEGKATAEKFVAEIEKDINAIQLKGMVQIQDMKTSLQRLQEIALKPTSMSTIDYINLLIEGQKSDAQDGWQERVKQLEDIKQRANILMKSAKPDFNPFDEEIKKVEVEDPHGQRTGIIEFLKKSKQNIKSWFK